MCYILFEFIFAISVLHGPLIVNANPDVVPLEKSEPFQKLDEGVVETLSTAYVMLEHCHNKLDYCPIGDGISMKSHESMDFMCPGENNSFQNIPNNNLLRFRCLCNDLFKSRSTVYSIEDMKCKFNETQDILDRGTIKTMNRYTKDGIIQIDSNQLKHYEIGFVLNSGGTFMKIIDVVLDGKNSRTHYVQSLVRANTKVDEKRTVNISSANSKYYEHKLEDVLKYFKPEVEERSFSMQIGWDTKNIIDFSDTPHPKYINEKSNKILVPTYMASPNSMADPASVLATNTLLNMAVQWKNIQEGNWAAIENYVNEMSTYFKRDLTVVTGVHGNLKLKEPVFNHMIQMHLFAKKHNWSKLDKLIPIPLYFIKIVIDTEKKTGITFVTVNNPYITSSKGYVLCANPVDEKMMKWPSDWSPENFKLGYSYACQVDDFLVHSGYLLKDNIAAGIQSLMYIPHSKQQD